MFRGLVCSKTSDCIVGYCVHLNFCEIVHRVLFFFFVKCWELSTCEELTQQHYTLVFNENVGIFLVFDHLTSE